MTHDTSTMHDDNVVRLAGAIIRHQQSLERDSYVPCDPSSSRAWFAAALMMAIVAGATLSWMVYDDQRPLNARERIELAALVDYAHHQGMGAPTSVLYDLRIDHIDTLSHGAWRDARANLLARMEDVSSAHDLHKEPGGSF